MIYLLANVSYEGLQSETVMIGPFETKQQQAAFVINLPDIMSTILPLTGVTLEPISWVDVLDTWPIMAEIEMSPYNLIRRDALVARLNGWAAQSNQKQVSIHEQALNLAQCINKIFRESGIPKNPNRIWS